jgi:hypothetical protein
MRQYQYKIICLFLDFFPTGFFHGNNYDISMLLLSPIFPTGFRIFCTSI